MRGAHKRLCASNEQAADKTLKDLPRLSRDVTAYLGTPPRMRYLNRFASSLSFSKVAGDEVQ
jgi:hypothetical protein